MSAKRKVTPRKVDKREYEHWVKWLKQQGYSGPFARLTTKHECIKLLAKELKKDPPTISSETRPRDPRTIVSNLTRHGRRGSQPRPKFETVRYESLRNLPLWVVQAQQNHLEGKGQQEMDIITYPGGIGIRQLLQRFQGCFLDIGPWSRLVWHPLDDHESMMIRLRYHLPDEAFWSQVKDFTDKAGECEGLLDAAHKRFTSAGEKLALLPPLTGPTPGAYITLDWGRRGVSRALGPPLGFEHLASYHAEELAGGNCRLICDGLIYRGPDAAKARKKHQRLVKRFQARDDFNQIVNLMKDLRNLRQQIIVRINQCLQDKEYIHYYCPSCPVYPFIRDFLPEESRSLSQCGFKERGPPMSVSADEV